MLPDLETLVVSWAKQNTSVDALISGRVSTSLPANPVFPYLVVQRVGGNPEYRDYELDRGLVQWDAYGSRGDSKPDYRSASKLVRTVISELMKLNNSFLNVTQTGEAAKVYNVQVTSGPRRVPGPDTGWARYSADTLFFTRGDD